MTDSKGSTGIESDRPELEPEAGAGGNVVETISMGAQHLRLVQVELSDVTDRHNELVQTREWLLHPSERELALSGNLFVVEDLVNGGGKILVKQAPLPHARPVQADHDLGVMPDKPGGFTISMMEAKGSSADSWAILDYEGGIVERSRVLHDWQRDQRPATPSHTLPRFVSNTWGDRSRDSRIEQSFLESEIDAAHRLGVDVVQIDDGWEQGVTANSALAREKGGVWEGFYNSDPDFWKPHPERLPNGLQPIADRARSHGMGLGLWFAPDSGNDFENWRRDVDTIVGFHRDLGVEHIKIDGVKARTQTSLENLQRFFQGVLDQTDGAVIFDLDVTAEVRPGYFGAMRVGPLFVENRYTDWHNYWPHQTLRNLWQLSRWVDPRRLRMEFLNHARNTEQYPGDALAPEHYDPATLFATVMFGNPLGWFEVSSLSEAYADSVAALTTVWKTHRQALFGGTILPIGSAPDGHAYTGFLSLAEGSGYVLVFREQHIEETVRIDLPGIDAERCDWEVLASSGDGAMVGDGERVRVTAPDKLGYVFGRYEAKAK